MHAKLFAPEWERLLSADETRVLVSSDETGVFNVYALPVAGGEAAAVTALTRRLDHLERLLAR